MIDQTSRTSVPRRSWRPRWAVVTACLIGSVSSLVGVVFLFAVVATLVQASDWQVVLLVIFGTFALSGLIVATPAIAFIARGGRLWFYMAVSAAVVAIAALSVSH